MKGTSLLTAIFVLIGNLYAQAQNFRNIENIGYDEISVIELGGNGDSWVGSTGQGVAFFNKTNQSWSYYNSLNTPMLPSDTITSIALRPIAGVQYSFVGTANGLAYAYNSTWDTLGPLPDPYVTGITINSTDTMWVFTRTGIVAFDTSSPPVLIHTYSTGLPSGKISCAQKGATHCGSGYWAGTDTSGCFSTKNGINYTIVSVDSGHLADNRVNTIYKDNSCAANLIGTKGGFSICPPNLPCNNFTTTEGLPQNDITSIAQDCYGHIWLGTRDSGMVVYNNPGFTRITTVNGLPTNQITSVSLPQGPCSNEVWIGMKDGNIAVVDTNKNVISILSGIGKVSKSDLNIRLFPQPAKDNVNIVFENGTVTGSFALTDMNGRIIQKQNLENNTNLILDVASVSGGLYFYQLDSDNKLLKTGKLEIIK